MLENSGMKATNKEVTGYLRYLHELKYGVKAWSIYIKINSYCPRSEVLYACKLFRLFQTPKHFFTVLTMNLKISHPRIKDMFEAMFPEVCFRKDSQHLAVFIGGPEGPQFCNRVDALFDWFQVMKKELFRNTELCQDLVSEVSIPANEVQDGLRIIFNHIFCFTRFF